MLRRQKAARVQAAVCHWRAANTAAAFRSWRQSAAQARELRSKARLVVARMQHLQLAAAWAAWRAACSRQAAKRQVLHTCVVRLRQGAVARCFATWREAAAQRAQLRSVGERCVLRLCHLALSRAWCQVRPAAASARDKATCMWRLPSSHAAPPLKHLPAPVHMQWRAYAAQKATQRAVVEGFQPRCHARIQRECFAGWQAAVAEEARMRAVVARLCHSSAVRVLQRWQVSRGEG